MEIEIEHITDTGLYRCKLNMLDVPKQHSTFFQTGSLQEVIDGCVLGAVEWMQRLELELIGNKHPI